MTVYEKINTLWKRTEKRPWTIIPGEYSMDEIPNVIFYEVTEKIDGMNMRVVFNKDGVDIRGRTDKAQIPDELKQHMKAIFTEDVLSDVFDLKKSNEVVLYGEGYGPKIQKGGIYRDDQSFILFDVLFDDVWASSEKVTEVAIDLDIQRVPIIAEAAPITWIEWFVKSRPVSYISETAPMEGVVCRSVPLMLTRLGKRVIFKLKTKDYDQLERVEDQE